MTATESFDAGIARQIGHYADAVRIPAGYDQIVVSGTSGLTSDGSLAGDMTGQATRARQGSRRLCRPCPSFPDRGGHRTGLTKCRSPCRGRRDGTWPRRGQAARRQQRGADSLHGTGPDQDRRGRDRVSPSGCPLGSPHPS